MSLILPVYRETGVIADVLAECCEALSTLGPCEIIVVDDASDDGTADVVEQYIGALPHSPQGVMDPLTPLPLCPPSFRRRSERSELGVQGTQSPGGGVGGETPRCYLITLPTRLGRGASFRAGVERAQGRFIGYMDADGQHDPRDILRAVNCLQNGADAVCGLRLQRDRPLLRRILTSGFRLLARLLNRLPCADPLCGFKFFKKDVLLSILPDCQEKHWNFDHEICDKIKNINNIIIDLPVIFRKSKTLHKSKTFYIKDALHYVLYLN